MTKLAEVIATLHTLPSPRGVALELMRLAGREDTSVADIAKIVHADPALTGRLIHAANRGIGARKRTGSLHEAVLRLGFSATRHIALCFSLVSDYRAGRCVPFDYGAFWTGSLLRGASSQAVAARAGGFDPQLAFVCGLLAGIGRLALATVQPQEYGELIDRDDGRGGASLRRMERDRFGIDHAELGAVLMERWTFPESMVRTVREFYALMDRPEGQSTSGYRRAWIMLLAEALMRGPAENAPAAWGQVALDAAAQLDLDAGTLSGIAADAAQAMSEWAPLLNLTASALNPIDYEAYARPDADIPRTGDVLDIVLVEDDESDRCLARAMLEEAGHRVHALASADEALAVIATGKSQMVIADWEMPDMDGIALCNTLRSTRVGRDLYVILYSGRNRGEELIAAIDAGADDFTAKSASPEILLARVNTGGRVLRRMDCRAGEFQRARTLAVGMATHVGPS